LKGGPGGSIGECDCAKGDKDSLQDQRGEKLEFQMFDPGN
jgi:hypothetical protein